MTKRDTTRVEVRLFGGPSVLASGTAVRLSPMQLALVTVVCGSGEVTRSALARILWSGTESPTVRQRLRQLLLSTNSRVGVRIIDAEGDALRPSEVVQCDVDVVRRGLGGHELRAAAECLAKGFVPMQLVGLSGEFDDWRGHAARRWSSALLRRARAKWSEAMSEGVLEDARDAAEAAYALDRRDPRSVAMVIEARGRAGRVGAAEAAYASYRDEVAAQDPEVEAVMARVRELAQSRDVEKRPSAVPLVGRDTAMRAIRRALDRVAAGRFAFVLVAGEAGIGKTRLLEEGRREGVLRGFRCLSAKAVEIERIIPLNPLLDALRGLDLKPHLRALGPPWNAVINSTLPAGTYDALVDEVPPIQESGLSRRLLDSLAMLLERLALEQPTILILDDLHWVDATTIAALQFFQRRWTQGPFGVFASVRPEQVAVNDPAATYLRGAEDLQVEEIALGELSHEDALELIDAIAEGQLDDDARTRVCALAGPHPLYLTELTRDLLSGDLELPELPADEVPIPVSLQQILRSRLDDLSDQAIRVARVLAVAARPLRLPELARLSGTSLDECGDRVEELQRKRLVEVDRDSAQIAHDLFRSALYKEIPPPRLALIHRTLAEQILAEATEESDGELAIHFGRAGERAPAANHAWKAATRAWDNGAMAEAANFFELVIEHEHDQVKRAEATAGLARALHLNRDIARANPLLELAAARLRAVGDAAQARRMDIRRVEGLAEVEVTTPAQLADRLDTIRQGAREVGDWEAVAISLDAELRIAWLDGNISDCRKLLAALREVASAEVPYARAIAHAGLAMGVLFDHPAAALDSAREAVRLSASGRPDQRLQALNRLLIVLYHQGLLSMPQNQPVVDEALKIAEGCGDRLQRFSLECNLAANALDSGNLDGADVRLNRAHMLLGSSEATALRVNLLINLGELSLGRGDFDAAEVAFRRIGDHLGPAAPKYASDLLNAGIGLCALESGRISEARRREEELTEAPSVWYYDPTTIASFRTRLLERRGKHLEALEMLLQLSEAIEDRLVLAWLKLQLLRCRLMLKHSVPGAQDIAVTALDVAATRGLSTRARQFEVIVARAGSKST